MTAILHSRPSVLQLSKAALVGIFTGFFVAVFKLSIEFFQAFCRGYGTLEHDPLLLALTPVIGGGLVGLLLFFGGPFQGGLAVMVSETDQESRIGTIRKPLSQELKTQFHFVRKSVAAIFTLGTGNSLGPEGPCVDIGMSVAQFCRVVHHWISEKFWERSEYHYLVSTTRTPQPRQQEQQQQQQQQFYCEKEHTWNLMLLSVGASAGVSAGFNAPISGVFFSLEIMQTAIIHAVGRQEEVTTPATGRPVRELKGLNTATTTTPVLISSILAALVSRSLHGNRLTLTVARNVKSTPLTELPLYLLLGALCGVVAFCFSYCVRMSQAVFAGEQGPGPLRATMRKIPNHLMPLVGGVLCGFVGLFYPQIRFFGYETLNSLLKDSSPLSTGTFLVLLVLKLVMTSICTGSGLVGGHFAPSLFMGATLGAAFQNAVSGILQFLLSLDVAAMYNSNNNNNNTNTGGEKDDLQTQAVVYVISVLQSRSRSLQVSDVPSYAMAGAAGILAALFRAPLTATMLLFEATRSYDAILPLMASSGVASLVGHFLDDLFAEQQQQQRHREDQRHQQSHDRSSNINMPLWQAIEVVATEEADENGNDLEDVEVEEEEEEEEDVADDDDDRQGIHPTFSYPSIRGRRSVDRCRSLSR